MTAYSANPAGEEFPIPTEADYPAELARLEALVEQARGEGKEIVVVMGVGFVGAVMAAVIADTVDKQTGQTEQVRHRLRFAQPAQLLEDSRWSIGASRRSRPRIPRSIR